MHFHTAGKGTGNFLDYFVDIEGGTVTISNNTVTACLGVASDGSTSAGMNVATYYNLGTTATITGNTVSNCSYGINVGIAGGIHGADYSIVTANNNNLAGNTHGFASLTVAYVDAINNWWGTAVPSAIIPLIEGNVTYIPYLNSAPGSSGSGTTVSGTMPEESITVGAPSAIDFGQFVLGMNAPRSSGTAGTVTAFANNWQVNVTASNGGFMRAAQDLATQLQISDGTISWVGAGTGFSYLGNPTSLPFEAEQNITGTDISHGAGSYTITITFTGALTN